MDPLIKETQVIKDRDGWDGNNRAKSNWALGLGIAGTVLGGAAVAKQGGLGGIFGNGSGPAPAPTTTVVYNPGPTACTGAMYAKECEDILNVTKGMYDLYIAGTNQAAAAREIDVAEKFGLYVNNRDSIDKLSERTNAEFFSLYKYTRDKDDENSAKLYDLAQQVAINTAVRPYQDKLIQCEIDNVYAALVNYVDRKTCRLIPGRLVLPSTPTVTGYSADCNCGTTEAGA